MRLKNNLGVLIAVLFAFTLLAGQIFGVPLGLAFVETGSMAPTMEPGDGFVALPPVLLGGVSEGDVVTFNAEEIENGRLTTHRVVAETSAGYITQGDANPFTDQQSAEPPVTRDRIVAEAVQIDGHVLVIPNLGEYVGAIRGVFTTVGAVTGFSTTQLAVFVFVALGVLYVFDDESSNSERDSRSTERADGLSGTLLIGGAILVILAAATLSMTAGSGVIPLAYDSVGADSTTQGGIDSGTTENVSVTLTNSGLVPVTATLTTEDPNATVNTKRVYLPPQSSREVNVSIAAPPTPGNYEASIQRNQYLAVLPGSVLSNLASVSHYAAVTAVNGMLAFVVGLLGVMLVGTGRIRLRSSRPVRTDIRMIRWIRSLYMKR